MGSEMCIRDSSRIKAKQLMKESRTQTTIWIEIITGQNNLNYIQSKMKNISPNCRFCEEEDETFEHLLLECVVFNQARRDIFKMESIVDKWNPQAILKFIYLPDILESFQSNLTEEYK